MDSYLLWAFLGLLLRHHRSLFASRIYHMDDTFPSTQLYIADSSWIMGNCSIRRMLARVDISRTTSLLSGTFWSFLGCLFIAVFEHRSLYTGKSSNLSLLRDRHLMYSSNRDSSRTAAPSETGGWSLRNGREDLFICGP